MQGEMLFWIWLSEALRAKNRDFRRLIALYEGPYELFHAEDAEIERIEGITPRTAEALMQKDLRRATEILDTCEQKGIGILPFGDPAYPEVLYDLAEPPVLMYYRGRLPDFGKRLLIGMVGTRKMSEYGLRSAYKIAYELTRAGAVTVSGMAAGIDGVCAAASLAAKGETVAVLGGGVDVVYPRHHKALHEAIAENGVLLSEYPPGTPPAQYHFPVRNRLIAGLSQGTVVVEAGIGSGSLITAKDAILQGKEVFALPANVGSRGAEGTNGLLRDGAIPVLESADVLKPYLYAYAQSLKPEALVAAQAESRADLGYLDRMGVIELTRRRVPSADTATTAVQPDEAPKRAPKPRASRAVKTPVQKTDTPGVGPTSAPAKQTARETPDAILASLSDIQREVLGAIPDDRAVTADVLAGLGYPYGEIASALTMLEIMGLVQKLPGALYAKA